MNALVHRQDTGKRRAYAQTVRVLAFCSRDVQVSGLSVGAHVIYAHAFTSQRKKK